MKFNNQDFEVFDLTDFQTYPNSENSTFNTEIIFENCNIKSFIASTRQIGQPVIFNNCKIGSILCHSTYFFGGLKMTDSIIQQKSTFDCGGHNFDPFEFIIDNCTFHKHLDFFDVYFGGPVQITNNNFKAGTSINLYLNTNFAIKDGATFNIKNNKGNLNTYADNDPLKNKSQNLHS